MTHALLIPAYNEEACIGAVVRDFCGLGIFDPVLVVDNGSSDGTAAVAREAGAVVICEPRRGYGSACLAGLDWLRSQPPEIVVFADGDGAQDPAEAPDLVAPIVAGVADLVIGARDAGEAGAMTPPQRFGNMLAAALMRYYYGVQVSDLGPFRAVSWTCLEALQMQDRDYGWTVEMQVKAARQGFRAVEVPVFHRCRTAGQSKVSGTVRGVIGAGRKILGTIWRHRP